MTTIVLLDAGPLGLVTNPNASPEFLACNQWLESLTVRGIRAIVPEITDDEVRRELLRAGRARGVQRLDALKAALGCLPITTEAMLTAARYWAQARNQGRPTAGNAELDCDVIPAAQAASIALAGDTPIVATTNLRHLSLFADARRWQDIG